VGKVLSELRKYPVHGICLTVNLPKAPIGSKRTLVGVRIKIAESEIQNTPWCVLAESKIQDTKGESRVFAIWFAICYTKGERFATQKAIQRNSKDEGESRKDILLGTPVYPAPEVSAQPLRKYYV